MCACAPHRQVGLELLVMSASPATSLIRPHAPLPLSSADTTPPAPAAPTTPAGSPPGAGVRGGGVVTVLGVGGLLLVPVRLAAYTSDACVCGTGRLYA
jgi:hypothetical protein